MIRQNKKTKTRSHKKQWLALAAVVVIALIAGGIFAYSHRTSDTSKSSLKQSTALENKLGRETTDQKGSQSQTSSAPSTSGTKQDSGDSQTGTTTPASTPTVTPNITFFGQAAGTQGEVDAFIPSITEDGGTCTLTVTNGGTTVLTKTSPAYANAQSTNCQNFTFDASGASTSWQATVSYVSSSHHGTSQAATYKPANEQQ